jgi:hypothetical protein
MVAGTGLGTSVGRAGPRLKLYPTLGTGLTAVKRGRPRRPTCTCGAVHPVINDDKVRLGNVPGRAMGIRAVASKGTTVSFAEERQANFLSIGQLGSVLDVGWSIDHAKSWIASCWDTRPWGSASAVVSRSASRGNAVTGLRGLLCRGILVLVSGGDPCTRGGGIVT